MRLTSVCTLKLKYVADPQFANLSISFVWPFFKVQFDGSNEDLRWRVVSCFTITMKWLQLWVIVADTHFYSSLSKVKGKFYIITINRAEPMRKFSPETSTV